MLIGLAGKAGSGKDTLANLITSKYTNFEVKHLTWPMEYMLNPLLRSLPAYKEFNTDLIDWNDREWKEKVIPELGCSPRKLKQTLGTEWRDATGDKLLWCKWLERNLTLYELQNTVVSDIRFPHEQDWVHDKGGIIIYINRPGLPTLLGHSSELSIDPSKIDYLLINDGTPEELLESFIARVGHRL